MKLVTAAALFTLCVGPVSGASHGNTAGPEPEQRILVGPLGYRAPGILYMLSGRAFSTLDFIDADHLLFTFHTSRLLRREENLKSPDNGQIIQALTLRLPEGVVETSADWRMHDRSRYLWPIGGGKFLVRRRDSFSLTDAQLQLNPYIEVASPVLATEVSPNGQVLVIEHEFERHSPEEHARLLSQAEKFSDAEPAEDTQITLMDTASRKVIDALHTELPINLPTTSDGYVGVDRDKGEDSYLVHFLPFAGKSTLLGKVASTCTPRENFINQKALLIESCGPKSADTYLDAWTTEGKKLWAGVREGHFVWPRFAYSSSGSRFAVSLLHVTHTIDLADSLNDEDVREQVVQVYDTATGNLLLSITASPVLTAGQNFALSGDGGRLAVLRQGAIEIYKVPPAKSPGN